MAVRAVVRPSTYRDSVALLRLAEELRALPGVREAAALMGTPANHQLLEAAGLATAETKSAGPGDLVLAVEAESDVGVAAALAAADGLLAGRRRAFEGTVRALGEGVSPRSLESARRLLPPANVVAISVPGAYAAAEARRALRQGLHVLLFSDNVPLADEVALKQLAVRLGLLCMGPDCGTAYVDGVGLGLANVVPRGRVGCVAASGTGLQAVASHLAALGEGISWGIGVGGRDLSAEVGGAMTQVGLEAVADDPGTAVVVLISKPPAPSVLPRIETALAQLGKPAVVCCLGAPPRNHGPGQWVTTLEDTARAAVAAISGAPWQPRAFEDPVSVRARLVPVAAVEDRRGPGLRGFYTGGTLAVEARLVLEPLIGPVASNFAPGGAGAPHEILDLGADEFTLGRPHPMLDPETRAARVREVGRDPAVGLVLVDLVLGRAVHPDPAGPLAAAVREARAAAEATGRVFTSVASVVGTEDDPQGLRAQIAALEAAGVVVLPSNAQAARFAALVLRPDLAPSLLGR